MFVYMNVLNNFPIQRMNTRANQEDISISQMEDIVAKYKYNYEDIKYHILVAK